MVQVSGATANYAEIDNTDVAEGRYFSTNENDAALVAFLGADVASGFLPSSSSLNQEVEIKDTLSCIGVAAAKGTIFGQPQDIS
jgi:hypothetical protein